jgi:hypothetical protein
MMALAIIHLDDDMKIATVAPLHRLMSTFPIGPSAVTTPPSPTRAKPREPISATAPLQPSGTWPSLCSESPCASTQSTPTTPSVRIATAHVSAMLILSPDRAFIHYERT